MKKILITGAAGFVGSHLVEHLLSQGIKRKDIRLFVKKGESLKNLPDSDFDIIESDIRDKNAVNKSTEGVETVYHLAANTVTEGSRYKDYKEVNVDGTQNILDACKGKNIRKFIYFSTIAVYGLPAYVGEIVNWNETQPKKPAEAYGESKLEAEKRVIETHEKTGIPYIIIRPTTVYGPRDYQGIFELYRAINKRYFFMIGNGRNKMDYVFVKDLVGGAREAELSKYQAGDYILGSGKPTTLNTIVNCISKSIGKEVPKSFLPKDLALAVSYLPWITGKLVGIKSPIFPNRVKILTTSCYYDISKAKEEIKYHPETPFCKGAEITGKWLIGNNQI